MQSTVTNCSNKNEDQGESMTRILFPEIINDKITTEEFLIAAGQVVRIIEKFGKLFAPVKYDMQGNINKLNSRLAMDRQANATLQDMILLEKEAENSKLIATDALIWLTRGLHMILLFFEYIVEDNKTGAPTDDLVAFLRKSYEEALEPHHGWMAQQLFALLSRTVPTRTYLLQTLAVGRTIDDDALLSEIELYLVNLRKNVVAIQEFYKKHNLQDFTL